MTINKHGAVGNSMSILAKFPSKKAAVETLEKAGWLISKQLGCGEVKSSLNARYLR